jgi:recombinational DNA repair ATPase RecF
VLEAATGSHKKDLDALMRHGKHAAVRYMPAGEARSLSLSLSLSLG